MFKSIWQKVKQNHFLMMILCCLVPIILVIGFFALFRGGEDWAWLFILLCPLMHIFMTRGHKQGLYQCPECGLKYKEKEWAEKCKNWCKKHKSCNIEITKRAIKNYEQKTTNH